MAWGPGDPCFVALVCCDLRCVLQGVRSPLWNLSSRDRGLARLLQLRSPPQLCPGSAPAPRGLALTPAGGPPPCSSAAGVINRVLPERPCPGAGSLSRGQAKRPSSRIGMGPKPSACCLCKKKGIWTKGHKETPREDGFVTTEAEPLVIWPPRDSRGWTARGRPPPRACSGSPALPCPALDPESGEKSLCFKPPGAAVCYSGPGKPVQLCPCRVSRRRPAGPTLPPDLGWRRSPKPWVTPAVIPLSHLEPPAAWNC